MSTSPQMSAWAWDGRAFAPCHSIPIEDRGFRYGMALFESIRVLRGRALFLQQHLTRLRAACVAREFHVADEAWEAVSRLLHSDEGGAFARIYVTGGDGGPGDPPKDCRIYVLREQREHHAPEGYHLALSQDLYRPLFGGLKTANYWLNIDALQRARRHGSDEALLFNENAELVSACMANVFLVHGDLIRTPSLACGARDGVLREWVMQQTPVRECSLFLHDVNTADEIFLTNSWIGVVPARSLEEGDALTTSYSSQLRTAYAKLIESTRITQTPIDNIAQPDASPRLK